MVAQPQSSEFAICPTCHGDKYLDRGTKRRAHLVPCLACRATGIVDTDRVCPTCGGWRNTCRCVIGWRNLVVLPAAPRTQKPISDQSVATESTTSTEPTHDCYLAQVLPNVQPQCELQRTWAGFYFCARCGHLAK